MGTPRKLETFCLLVWLPHKRLNSPDAGSKISSGPASTTGDVIGCGLFGSELFFTKNGRVLTELIPLGNSLPGLWPTIGMKGAGVCCSANFGQIPFKCNLSSAFGNKSKSVVQEMPETLMSKGCITLAGTGKTWLKVLRDNRTARASGNRQPKDVLAVRATSPLSAEGCLYFEVLIVATGHSGAGMVSRTTRKRTTSHIRKLETNKKSNGRSLSTPHSRPILKNNSCEVTVGLCTKKNGSLLHHCGADSISYGYCGSDGSKRHQGLAHPFGEMFGTGDVIGCGWDPYSGCIYFTKNGTALGVAFSDVTANKLYPTIGLGMDGEIIRTNFENSWLAQRAPDVIEQSPTRQRPRADTRTSFIASPEGSPQNASIPIQEHALEIPDCRPDPRCFSPTVFTTGKRSVLKKPVPRGEIIRGVVTQASPAQLQVSALQPSVDPEIDTWDLDTHVVCPEEHVCQVIMEERPPTPESSNLTQSQSEMHSPGDKCTQGNEDETKSESDWGLLGSSEGTLSPPPIFLTGLGKALNSEPTGLSGELQPLNTARSIPDEMLGPEDNSDHEDSQEQSSMQTENMNESVPQERHPRYRLQAAGRMIGYFSLRASTLSTEADIVPDGTSEPVDVGTDDIELSWRKGNMLGEGAFGEVFLGLDEDSGALIAIKQIEVPTVQESHEQRKWIRTLRQEIGMLAAFDHPNIVRYIGTQQQGHLLHILMEYMPGGSIEALLRRFGPFKEKMTRQYISQTLSGLEYLHSVGVQHRDIKGANILLSSDGMVKLADFGASKRIECFMTNSGSDLSKVIKLPAISRTNSLKDGALKSLKGTPYWMAPEVLNGEPDGAKGDIWSVGCVVCEMMTGRPPFADKGFVNAIALMMHIVSDGTTPKMPEGISEDGCAFLKLCFERNAAARPTAEELLQHPFTQVQTPNRGCKQSSLQKL